MIFLIYIISVCVYIAKGIKIESIYVLLILIDIGLNDFSNLNSYFLSKGYKNVIYYANNNSFYDLPSNWLYIQSPSPISHFFTYYDIIYSPLICPVIDNNLSIKYFSFSKHCMFGNTVNVKLLIKL